MCSIVIDILKAQDSILQFFSGQTDFNFKVLRSKELITSWFLFEHTCYYLLQKFYITYVHMYQVLKSLLVLSLSVLKNSALSQFVMLIFSY